MEAGTWFEWADRNETVVDQSVAEILRLSVGDSFDLNSVDKKLHLRVTGIVHKPAVLAVHLHSIYVPLHTMQKFVGAEGRVSRVMIDFRPGVDQRSFEARWRPKIM